MNVKTVQCMVEQTRGNIINVKTQLCHSSLTTINMPPFTAVAEIFFFLPSGASSMHFAKQTKQAKSVAAVVCH